MNDCIKSSTANAKLNRKLINVDRFEANSDGEDNER